MIKLIVGKKGSGKTKALVEIINAAAKQATGNLVCVEKGMKLTFDIDHSVRLLDSEDYGINSYETFYGFIAGLCAGNFDITEIYTDGILRIGAKDNEKDLEGFGKLLARLDKLLTEQTSSDIIFTVSADEDELPESVKKYL